MACRADCGASGQMGSKAVSTAELILDRDWLTRPLSRPAHVPPVALMRHDKTQLPPRPAMLAEMIAPTGDAVGQGTRRWPNWAVGLSVLLHVSVAAAALILPGTPPVLTDGMTVEVVGAEMLAGEPSTGPAAPAEQAVPVRQLAARALPDIPMDAAAPPLPDLAIPAPTEPQLDLAALDARPTPEPPPPEMAEEPTLPPEPIPEPEPVPEPIPEPKLPPEPEPTPEPAPEPPPPPPPPAPEPPPPSPPPPKAELPKPKPVKPVTRPKPAPAVAAAQPVAVQPVAVSAGAVVANSALTSTQASAQAQAADSRPAASQVAARTPSGAGEPSDRGASLLTKPSIEYPRRALRRGLQGVVEVAIRVGTDGLPLEVNLAKSSGVRDLDEAAIKLAWQYRFKPAYRAGMPVTWDITQPVEFVLQAAR